MYQYQRVPPTPPGRLAAPLVSMVLTEPPPPELPVVRNVTVGRSVRLDPLAWRRLNESSFDLGRDTLDITAQGRIRLDDGSFVHRFYTNDDVMLQAVSAIEDGSDADDFTIFHPHTSTYPANRQDQAAFVARLMRGSLLEVLRADYVRTARAKGLPERTVIGRHALRNALIPVVTYAGVSLGVLFGGAIITETIFQYNGVGYLLSRAIVNSNAPVVIAVVVFSVVAYVFLSLLVDILYAVLDPRIRLS